MTTTTTTGADLGRRTFLSLAATGIASATVAVRAQQAVAVAPRIRIPSAPAGRWAGHQPGKVYLGMSTPSTITAAEAATGRTGVHRTFHTWDGAPRELTMIRANHASGHLPWISFKPPGGAASWSAIASGQHDAALRQRALGYASLKQPVVVTFHHEPTNDSDDGAAFAAAWTRIYDVMTQTASLKHVSMVPIIGDWAFNPRNKASRPEAFLPDGVLQRMAFLGIDCYQNASGETLGERLDRIHGWMGERGFGAKMLGVGETGATELFGSPTAVQWWSSSWGWVTANTDKVGVVSYFNSTRNSKADVHWAFDESTAKLAAFKKSLVTSQACRLTGASTTPGGRPGFRKNR